MIIYSMTSIFEQPYKMRLKNKKQMKKKQKEKYFTKGQSQVIQMINIYKNKHK